MPASLPPTLVSIAVVWCLITLSAPAVGFAAVGRHDLATRAAAPLVAWAPTATLAAATPGRAGGPGRAGADPAFRALPASLPLLGLTLLGLAYLRRRA